MINKLRPHRVALLELIEELNLTNYTYSLPWQENPFTSLPVTNYMIGTETQMTQGIRSGSIRNSQNYKQLLQKTVFEPSCISLITEPVFFERESILTEKTIMSIYSGTLPIWVGGWRCADALRSFGFDVFDDIVDHSYQDLDDPFDRCYHAIERNLNLLRDFDLVHKFVQNNKSRFEHNFKLLKNNVFQKTVDQVKIDGI